MSLIVCCILSGRSYPTSSAVQPSNVEYSADVYDKFALCKLKQTFNITVDGISEACYQFPVDYNSAFCDLLIRTPREDIRGKVKEKDEAKKMFDDAKREGRQAFLTEESDNDRDIYKLSMCNLLKGDEIIVEYTYITEVEFSDGRNIFYIPSFISPRYGGDFIPSSNHSVQAHIKLNNPVTLVRASMPDVTVSLSSCWAQLDYQSHEVIEKDIEITYHAEFLQRAIKFHAMGHTMGIIQFIPNIDCTKNTNELVFILDCSGSMEGDRINFSKKAICHCLEKMRNTNFNFNIIRYGSTYEMYSTEPVAASDYNIEKAIKYCKNIRADLGGTETYTAIEVCLKLSKTAILITDGDTSDNERMQKLCKQFDCLSILGIGSGINRANIRDMVKNGSGIALFSQTDTNIQQNMNLIFNSINIPSIKDPTFFWNKTLATPLTNKSPIISGQPNVVFAIIDDIPDAQEFRVVGLNFSLEVCPYNGPIDPQYLGSLVAKRIIQENEISESFTKEKIIDLATNFNIITKYTSMIAVSTLGVINPQPILEENMAPQYMLSKCCIDDGDDCEEDCCDEVLLIDDPQPEQMDIQKEIMSALDWGIPFELDSFEDITQYFDETNGVFKSTIRAVFPSLSDSLLKNENALTLFVLLFMNRYPEYDNIFGKYYNLVMKNETIASLAGLLKLNEYFRN